MVMIVYYGNHRIIIMTMHSYGDDGKMMMTDIIRKHSLLVASLLFSFGGRTGGGLKPEHLLVYI
jgi:hypothetical protein